MHRILKAFFACALVCGIRTVPATAAGLKPPIAVSGGEAAGGEKGKGGPADGGPPNDDCSLAQLIEAGSSAIFNNANASTDPSDPYFTCHRLGFQPGVNTLWFRFQARSTSADLSLCNPGTDVLDTLLAVYSGSCGAFTELACNDDAGCGPFGGRQSRLSVSGLVLGEYYYVQVASWDTFNLGQMELTLAWGPVNIDVCSTALLIDCGTTTTFDTSTLTTDPSDPSFTCSIPFGPQQGFKTAWFAFFASDTDAIVSLCNPGTLVVDTLLAVYSGACGALSQIDCSDDAHCDDSGFPPWVSRVTLSGLTPGQVYYIEVAGWDESQFGQMELTLECSTPIDDCVAARHLYCDSTWGIENSLLTTDPSDPIFSCRAAGAQQGYFTAWFTFAPAGSQANISLCHPDTLVADTLLAVYSGTCGALTEVACDDNAGCGPFGLQSTLTATGLIPGQTYYIQVAGRSGVDHGPIFLTVSCGPDCNNNSVPDAQDIASGFSKDCFNYSAAPNTRGGANAIPDECECLADWNRDGTTNSTDVSDFINTFFADQVSGGLDGDVNCDGTSNSTDVSDFINIWFSAQAGQLPFAGCVI